MATIAPSTLFPGYTFDGTKVSFALSAFEDLSLAEADPGTGDARKLIYEFIKAFNSAYQALPEADRPVQMSTSEGIPTGQSPGEIRKSYTFTFDLDISGVDVASEPI